MLWKLQSRIFDLMSRSFFFLHNKPKTSQIFIVQMTTFDNKDNLDDGTDMNALGMGKKTQVFIK